MDFISHYYSLKEWFVQSKFYYFSHARTALKYGLEYLDIKRDDYILLPDYICEVILHPLDQLKIKYRYYSIKDDLTPNWIDLEKAVCNKTKAVVMVHYFGHPQNIKKFQSFCEDNKLKLIEDNAHGYGGIYKNKMLGTFGDIGISSPRKSLNIYSGGILWIRNNEFDSIQNLPVYPITAIEYIKMKLKTAAFLKNCPKKYLKRPVYEDPNAFFENQIPDYRIDQKSKMIINKANLVSLRDNQQKSYKKWQNFAIENNLVPVFKNLHSGANPWCFPAYAKDKNEVIKWFNWGWKNNKNVFSWPSLPKELIQSNSQVLSRWKRLLCFSTLSLSETQEKIKNL